MRKIEQLNKLKKWYISMRSGRDLDNECFTYLFNKYCESNEEET